MPESFLYILVGSLIVAALALLGAVVLFLGEERLRRMLPGLIGLAAGSLLGSALFHMLPTAAEHGDIQSTVLWVAIGFVAFLLLDFALRARSRAATKPQVPLILIGDGLHNFAGGLSVGAIYLLDPSAGVSAWLAAVLHEIPQEMGDFGVLIDGGLRPAPAVGLNFLSALMFPLGALANYFTGGHVHLPVLAAVGAGSFVYLAIMILAIDIFKGRDTATRLFAVAAMGLGVLFQALIGH